MPSTGFTRSGHHPTLAPHYAERSRTRDMEWSEMEAHRTVGAIAYWKFCTAYSPFMPVAKPHATIVKLVLDMLM